MRFSCYAVFLFVLKQIIFYDQVNFQQLYRRTNQTMRLMLLLAIIVCGEANFARKNDFLSEKFCP